MSDIGPTLVSMMMGGFDPQGRNPYAQAAASFYQGTQAARERAMGQLMSSAAGVAGQLGAADIAGQSAANVAQQRGQAQRDVAETRKQSIPLAALSEAALYGDKFRMNRAQQNWYDRRANYHQPSQGAMNLLDALGLGGQ